MSISKRKLNKTTFYCSIFRYIFLFCLGQLILGCSDTNNNQTIQAIIDNPSAEKIKITFNGTILDIPPFEYKTFSVHYGYNDISFDEGLFPEEINKKQFSLLIPPTTSNDILLNPTGHLYVQAQFNYDDSTKDLNRLKSDSVLNNAFYYKDHAILVNSLIVFLTTDFDVLDINPHDLVHEDLTNQLNTLIHKNNDRIVSHLYRIEDYQKLYSEKELLNTAKPLDFITVFKPFTNDYDLSHFSDRPALKKLISDYMSNLNDLQYYYQSPNKFFKKLDVLNEVQAQILNHREYNELNDNILFRLWGPQSLDNKHTGSYLYGATLFLNNS